MEQNLRQTKTMNYECKLQSEAKQHNFPPPDPRRKLVPVLALRQPTGSAPRSQSAALTNEKYTKKTRVLASLVCLSCLSSSTVKGQSRKFLLEKDILNFCLEMIG